MTSIETITLAAHESACERLARIIRWLVAGWALSMLIMGLAVMMLATYEEEVVTETTSEVSQDSGDYGNNLYAGGDMTYGQADNQDDKDGASGEAAGSGGGSEEPAD